MKAIFIFLVSILLLACGQSESEQAAVNEQQAQADNNQALIDVNQIAREKPVQANTANNSAFKVLTEQQRAGYESIGWDHLIPKENLDALLNPPDYMVDIDDGMSSEEVIAKVEQLKKERQIDESKYEEALTSTEIIEEMDGKKIRIPGFIVPVDFNDQQQVTSFFLVPYFGACIHEPPPPPNQVVYVKSEAGFELDSIYDAVWVSGKLTTGLFEDPLATSAYILEMDHVELYQEGS